MLPPSLVVCLRKLVSATVFISSLRTEPDPSLGVRKFNDTGFSFLGNDAGEKQPTPGSVEGDDRWWEANRKCSFIFRTNMTVWVVRLEDINIQNFSDDEYLHYIQQREGDYHFTITIITLVLRRVREGLN